MKLPEVSLSLVVILLVWQLVGLVIVAEHFHSRHQRQLSINEIEFNEPIAESKDINIDSKHPNLNTNEEFPESDNNEESETESNYKTVQI